MRLQAHDNIKSSVDETAVNIQHHIQTPWPSPVSPTLPPIPLSLPRPTLPPVGVQNGGCLHGQGPACRKHASLYTPDMMSRTHSQGSRITLGPSREWVWLSDWGLVWECPSTEWV